MAPVAESKKAAVGQATTITMQLISGGKELSLTDMQGNGLHSKAM